MGLTEQGGGHPTLNVATYPQVGLLIFCPKAEAIDLKCGFRLHTEETIHQNDKGG